MRIRQEAVSSPFAHAARFLESPTMQQAAELPNAAVIHDRPVRRWLSEDWVAVAAGTALVVLVLAGVRPGVPALAWGSGADFTTRVLAIGNLARAIQIGLLLLAISGAAAVALGIGSRLPKFIAGFPAIYVLAWLSQVLAGNATMTTWGLEYVIFALAIGLLVGHTTSFRAGFAEAVQAEFYIKIGLIVMGAGILFSELVQIGVVGIVQAIVVVLSVWFFSFWLAKRLEVDDELATMMASAVSICGVSAAIAACGAIQGDRKKLSYVTSLVLIVAVPMLIVMPWIAKATAMTPAVAGAWLGGTLDTSAAVVAAGEIVSPQARNAAVVVKLSQNVLIGVAAFLLTVWWTVRNKTNREDVNVGVGLIWERFPKFVLGFILASLVFSFMLPSALVADTRNVLTALRTNLFALAFVCIGLETSLGDLVGTGQGRPIAAFLGGQAFNVVVTLVMAYLLFSGVLLPAPQL
jgi:uncharacterized integral membrane protein (TIGR00698 family)